MKEKLLDILERICDDLFEEGLLDSLAVAELIVAIEEEFKVILSPTEYEKEELSTVHRIEKILEAKGVK